MAERCGPGPWDRALDRAYRYEDPLGRKKRHGPHGAIQAPGAAANIFVNICRCCRSRSGDSAPETLAVPLPADGVASREPATRSKRRASLRLLRCGLRRLVDRARRRIHVHRRNGWRRDGRVSLFRARRRSLGSSRLRTRGLGLGGRRRHRRLKCRSGGNCGRIRNRCGRPVRRPRTCALRATGRRRDSGCTRGRRAVRCRRRCRDGRRRGLTQQSAQHVPAEREEHHGCNRQHGGDRDRDLLAPPGMHDLDRLCKVRGGAIGGQVEPTLPRGDLTQLGLRALRHRCGRRARRRWRHTQLDVLTA